MQTKVAIINGREFSLTNPEKIQMIKALRDPLGEEAGFGRGFLGLKIAKDFIDWIIPNGTEGCTYTISDHKLTGTVKISLVFEYGSIVKLLDTGHLARVANTMTNISEDHIGVTPLGDKHIRQYLRNAVTYLADYDSVLAQQFIDIHRTLIK